MQDSCIYTWQCDLLSSSPSPTSGISPHAISPELPTPICPSPIPPNRPQCVVLPSLCPCVLIVQHPPVSENMRCLIFCSCVSLLRMMVSSFIHIPAKDMISFSFYGCIVFHDVYVPHFFIQSIIGGHLGWFQVFAIVNCAAMNIRVHVSL